MSDDLISRKALMEEIEYSFILPILKMNLRPEHEAVLKIQNIIMTMPTAFDKEKVIEELTIHKKFADYKTQEFDEAGDVRNMEIQDFVSLALQGAIRIVEKGGLNWEESEGEEER